MLFLFPLFPAPLAPVGSLKGWARLASDSGNQLLQFGALASVQFTGANGIGVSQGSQKPPYPPGNSHTRLSALQMHLSHQEEVLSIQPGDSQVGKTHGRCRPLLWFTVPGEGKEWPIGHSQIAKSFYLTR